MPLVGGAAAGSRAFARSGQAMIETVIAVVLVTFLFLALFRLSQILTGKVLLEHAAMRVARARAVGLNEFMCHKAARVAVIPVAGERLWPIGEDDLDYAMELSRIPIYMGTPNAAVANGVLEYEGWHRLGVEPGSGTRARTDMRFSLFGDYDRPSFWDFTLSGEATTESNFPLYMRNEGR